MAKMMKPVLAWAHVDSMDNMISVFGLNLYRTKAEAKEKLCGMGKYGFRIARVRITEQKA